MRCQITAVIGVVIITYKFLRSWNMRGSSQWLSSNEKASIRYFLSTVERVVEELCLVVVLLELGSASVVFHTYDMTVKIPKNKLHRTLHTPPAHRTDTQIFRRGYAASFFALFRGSLEVVS